MITQISTNNKKNSYWHYANWVPAIQLSEQESVYYHGDAVFPSNLQKIINTAWHTNVSITVRAYDIYQLACIILNCIFLALLILYMDKVFDIIASFGFRCHSYADNVSMLLLLLLLLHPFKGLFSRTIRVSQHQKGKSFWILLEQEMMGWQWH